MAAELLWKWSSVCKEEFYLEGEFCGAASLCGSGA